MADSRQFTDHNEVGGVNVYLEDKKLAESPSQSTVASTDYFVLKDTDGVPHKIVKADVLEMVRDAMGTILANNNKGTSVAKVPTIGSTGNDLGSSSVADLASVLGVGFKGTINSSSGQSYDMDSLADGSYIYFDEGNLISHNPLGQSSFGVIINKKLGSSKIQFVYLVSYSNPKKYYIASRVYNIELSGWNGWFKIELT